MANHSISEKEMGSESKFVANEKENTWKQVSNEAERSAAKPEPLNTGIAA